MAADAIHAEAEPTRARAARWAIRLLALGAMVVSALLLAQSLAQGDVLPGCGAASGCESVLASAWSKWRGIPVAAPAIVVYAVALAASLHIGPKAPATRRKTAWGVLLLASTLALGAAIWFTYVQIAEIGALCRYCVTAHACGAAMAAVAFAAAPIGGRGDAGVAIKPAGVFGLIVAGLMLLSVLVTGQLTQNAPTSEVYRVDGAPVAADTGPDRVISLPIPQGWAQVQPHTLPVLGSPDAPVILAEIMDYTCPHCRKLHPLLEAARERYEGKLAVMPLVAPLDADCNRLIRETEERHQSACELATLSLAVWKADPNWYEAFHHYLMQGAEPPSPEDAKARAEQLVGAERLAAALADPWVLAQVKNNIELYAMYETSLPLMLTQTTYIRGRPGTAEELFAVLDAEPGLAPPGEPAAPLQSTP